MDKIKSKLKKQLKIVSKKRKTKKIRGGVINIANYSTTNDSKFLPDKEIKNINIFVNTLCEIIISKRPRFIRFGRFIIEITSNCENPDGKKFIFGIKNGERRELVHITCFKNSSMHITFIIGNQRLYIYSKINPNLNNGLNDLVLFVENIKKDIFENDLTSIYKSFWNTEWKYFIKYIYNIEYNNSNFLTLLDILLEALNHVINKDILRLLVRPTSIAETEPIIRPTTKLPKPRIPLSEKLPNRARTANAVAR